jgi:excinuclease ABC subunit A
MGDDAGGSRGSGGVADQSPISRTPRSNPGTYVGLFTPNRDLFSKLPEARARGYKPGRFSFNVKGGRCENCEGDGTLRIEMHFLSDVYITCDVCQGKRYNHETLEIRYKGKNIAEVLDMTVEEAYEFFKKIPVIERKLRVLKDVGLDYIKLGQSALTLSGGEAQRVKLATQIGSQLMGVLYILDEPTDMQGCISVAGRTDAGIVFRNCIKIGLLSSIVHPATTGLHFADVKKLVEVLQLLVDQGNTVVLIEHNLDVINQADYLIDLGPEGGEKGGQVLAVGTPEEVARSTTSYIRPSISGRAWGRRSGKAEVGSEAPFVRSTVPLKNRIAGGKRRRQLHCPSDERP